MRYPHIEKMDVGYEENSIIDFVVDVRLDEDGSNLVVNSFLVCRDFALHTTTHQRRFYLLRQEGMAMRTKCIYANKECDQEICGYCKTFKRLEKDTDKKRE